MRCSVALRFSRDLNRLHVLHRRNSLHGLSNEGVFTSSQKTDAGNTPSDDLLSVKVSAGKAYVRGYDIETASTTLLDVEKPRDKKSVSQSLVPF